MGKARTRLITATFPPFSKNGPPIPPQGGSQKRDIPKDHAFDAKALKPMSQALWASSVALGHALTAYRHFTRLKSATVSPDGRLGGRGYVMGMAEIRQNLYEVCEKLSSISDTLYDEINAPHWKPKLAQLDEGDQEDVERFVEESQEVLESPEDEAEEHMEAIQEKGHKKKHPEDQEPKGSELPGGGAPETAEGHPTNGYGEASEPSRTKEASRRIVSRYITERELRAIGRGADPAILAGIPEQAAGEPAELLPGPRVTEWAEGPGPLGSFNFPEDATSDAWGLDESHDRDYAYPSSWDNDMSHGDRGLLAESQTWAESALPSDDTSTEAWDFGLGYGARDQGAGGYANPSDEGNGRGVWGPRSRLPGVPDQSSGDSVTPIVDVHLNERHAVGLLPGDTSEPVARRDEYEGAKGNLVQRMSESELPGWGPAPAEIDQPVDIDTGYVNEDLATSWLPLGSPGTVLPPGTPGTRVE